MTDSALVKIIRPAAFIFMLSISTLLSFIDGNISYEKQDKTVYIFTVKPAWVDLWTGLTITFAAFYAAGRSAEKISKIKNL